MIEQPDSSKPRDSWSDPRLTPVRENQPGDVVHVDNPEPSDMFPPIPDYSISSAIAHTKASIKGWDIILPTPTELFIDIDNEADYEKMRELIPTFLEFRPNAVVTRDTPSPSGKPGHRHVVIDTKETIEDLERVLLQAVLGSDRKRELLAWRRVENDDSEPTLFYEKKPKLEPIPVGFPDLPF